MKTNHSVVECTQSHEAAAVGNLDTRGAGIYHKSGDGSFALTPCAGGGWSTCHHHKVLRFGAIGAPELLSVDQITLSP